MRKPPAARQTSSKVPAVPAADLAPSAPGEAAHQRALASIPTVAVARPEPRSRLANLSYKFIPGRKRPARPLVPALAALAPGAAKVVKRHKGFVTAVTLVVVVLGILVEASGMGERVGLAGPRWQAQAGATIAPTPTPLPAPNILSAAYYVNAYGFDYPSNIQPIPSDERQRLVSMLPFDLQATAAYDARYGARITPQLVMWWTHAEGIGGHINYSNCANMYPRAGTSYFSDIENCTQANFWQLGYGNQFALIYILKNAFTDMHGDPNDPRLVQRVGQWVLNYDRSQGTVPACGGYSCTFPALTIDQILSGVNETTGVVTADNWWASVLSRDPAINCYMIAHALSFFNHVATQHWVGCYYAEPCWGNESDRLGDILAAWPSLRKAAGV